MPNSNHRIHDGTANGSNVSALRAQMDPPDAGAAEVVPELQADEVGYSLKMENSGVRRAMTREALDIMYAAIDEAREYGPLFDAQEEAFTMAFKRALAAETERCLKIAEHRMYGVIDDQDNCGCEECVIRGGIVEQIRSGK